MPVYLDIVDVLGKRLYAGKVSWIREYVQNSIDARSSNITIELRDSDLIISDDGKGISERSLKEDAFSPGGSSKEPSQIGELGVGIFAGTGICSKIKILTKEENSTAYEAIFDADKYREIIDSNPRALFDDHIGSIYTVEKSPENFLKKDHFTKLLLQGLVQSSIAAIKGEIGISWQRTDIQSFLEKTVDLPIDRSFQFKEELETFLGKSENVFDITIKMDGEVTNLRKFMFIDNEFIDYLYKRELKDSDGKILARAWAAYSKNGKDFSGSRFLIKFKGMTIGDEGTIAVKTGRRMEKRLLGEIVAYSENLQVNTERDWFVDNEASDEFIEFVGNIRSELFNISNADSTILQSQIKIDNEIKSLRKDVSEISPKSTEAKDKRKKIEEKKNALSSLKEQADSRLSGFEVGKQPASEEAVNLFKEIHKVRVNSLHAPSTETTAEETKSGKENEEQVQRKSPVPKTVRNFLTEHIVDETLGSKIKRKDDVKDLSNNAFTYVEILLKTKSGMKATDQINSFRELVEVFLDKNDPPSEVQDNEKSKFIRAFKEALLSAHYFWRNPSAHTFMEEMRDDRFLFQAIMISDYVVYLINNFTAKKS